MTTIAQSWGRASEHSAPLSFIDISLRGAGQVMFQDNPLTGLLFLIGILWGSIASGSMEVIIGSVIGLITATAAAMIIRVDHDALHSGLYGYNGILVGAALTTFLAPSPLLWIYLIFGAVVSTIVMLAISHVGKILDVSALTYPFVLTTLVLFLATYYFPNTGISRLPHPAIPLASHPPAVPFVMSEFLPSIFTGVSQVFLVQNVITGVIFLVALAVSSVPTALFALGGSALAVAVASTLGADGSLISAGLFGFSPVLTAIALGTVFYTPRNRIYLYTFVGTVFTVIVQASLNVMVAPFGIPTLTMPFVLVTWLFLLPQKDFAPVPHKKSESGALN